MRHYLNGGEENGSQSPSHSTTSELRLDMDRERLI